MSFDITSTESKTEGVTGKLVCSGELCIFNALEIKSRLFDMLEANTTQEVDLAQVTEVDTAGVQLLLMAKREAAKQDCSLNFINHGNALLDVIELLRLSGNFGDPVVIPATQGEG